MQNNKALFIGPYGENKDEFQKLVNKLLEDVVHWRRNFHPNDNNLIKRKDQREKSFLDTQDKIYSSLDKLLGEMKQSVPFQSPRFLGHMHSDLLTPALLGYFTGLLYNQNNVVGESSPITTRKEIEFVSAMCKMVGFNDFGLKSETEINSWGHLTSGGSTAVLEAVWLARNMKYYPLSVMLLIKGFKQKTIDLMDLKEEIKSNFSDIHDDLVTKILTELQSILSSLNITTPNGKKNVITDLHFLELFNLTNKSICEIKETIFDKLANYFIKNTKIEVILKNEDENKVVENSKKYSSKIFQKAIDSFLVQEMGVAGIHMAVNKLLDEDEELKLPKLYVSQTAHYSWEKNLDILGLGKTNVVKVKCDDNFRLDINELESKIEENRDSSILMIGGILGTTEESAIDPITKIVAFKEELHKKNRSFYFQIDGAWGGYFCSLINRDENEDKGIKTLFEANNDLYKNIEKDLIAVAECDSIVIDPHKMGYIPYAVGAILYKDTRYKDFIYKAAPYLATSSVGKDPIEQTYMGGWTLEGSRSGAAALACSLTSDVVPLNRNGYGNLVLQGFKFSNKLFKSFEERNNTSNDIKIIPIYEPQTNIVCFLVAAPNYITQHKHLELLNNAVFNGMTIKPNKVLQDYNFVTSKTDLSYKKYKSVIDKKLKESGVNTKGIEDSFDLCFLRSVTINPMIEDYKINVWSEMENKNIKVPLFEGFANEIERIAKKALPDILFQIIQDRRKVNGKSNTVDRLKLLWVENNDNFDKIQSEFEMNQVAGIPNIGEYLDIYFYNYYDAENKVENHKKRLETLLSNNKYDFSILDLNLIDRTHKEYESGFNVINDLYPNQVITNAGIPILYSQFLNPTSKKINSTDFDSIMVKNKFKKQYPGLLIGENEEQFLPKNSEGDEGFDNSSLFELIKRIFLLLQ